MCVNKLKELKTCNVHLPRFEPSGQQRHKYYNLISLNMSEIFFIKREGVTGWPEYCVCHALVMNEDI